ncbi:hypothetical protein [Halotalea alkalilenta]|uniref:hypothetical protein n=1 Tax=Halotalea alkalilenta TaxID=376489 RepID=UPI000487EEB6|nr:hypothetical protein [Halotalea alkalilenta]
MPLTPEYRLLAELEHAFDHLIEQSLELAAAFASAGLPSWQLEPTQSPEAWLRAALTDFWYQDGQDGRATRSYVGLIAADAALLQRVEAVNARKDAFGALIKQIKAQAPGMIAEIKATLPFRHPLLHDHLKGRGMARLHLKQCWRRMPLAAAPVARVRMAWYSNGRSIKRLSVAEAEERLKRLDLDAPHVRIQYQRLAALPSTEILAQVQHQAPVMRANLFFREPLEDGHTRQAMNVALPLVLPPGERERSPRLPDHNLPPASPPAERSRARRRDARLEDEPYLPSLRIHRYRGA